MGHDEDARATMSYIVPMVETDGGTMCILAYGVDKICDLQEDEKEIRRCIRANFPLLDPKLVK